MNISVQLSGQKIQAGLCWKVCFSEGFIKLKNVIYSLKFWFTQLMFDIMFVVSKQSFEKSKFSFAGFQIKQNQIGNISFVVKMLIVM